MIHCIFLRLFYVSIRRFSGNPQNKVIIFPHLSVVFVAMDVARVGVVKPDAHYLE